MDIFAMHPSQIWTGWNSALEENGILSQGAGSTFLEAAR